jgi:hypothetical protein
VDYTTIKTLGISQSFQNFVQRANIVSDEQGFLN